MLISQECLRDDLSQLEYNYKKLQKEYDLLLKKYEYMKIERDQLYRSLWPEQNEEK